MTSGLVDHPIRIFTIVRADGSREDINGHTVVCDNGVLSVVYVRGGLPYVVRGFAAGTWVDYVATLPSHKEIADVQAEADRVSRAREVFDGLGPRDNGGN